MIQVRQSTVDDAHALFAALHPVTRGELDASGVWPENVLHLLKSLAASLGSRAVLVDGEIAVLASSAAQRPGVRVTACFLADRNGPAIARAARAWARAERKRHPRQTFEAVSYSSHPERDRFMAGLGMKKVSETMRFAVFSDSQPSLDKKQALR